MSSFILKVNSLSVRRGATEILSEVSWEMRAGENWAMLGANGSGKTSLLNCLTGYLTPTSGEIELLGQRYGASDWRELRKRIGMVSAAIHQKIPDSELALDCILSGRSAMIEFWGRATKEERARAVELLAQIECSHLRDRPWAYLSQGERQRVLIGRALMAAPSVLILDEPCAGLDPAAREQFLAFLQRLAPEPDAPALIFVTHHVEEILPLFSHLLVLRQGKVLASGRKRKVLVGEILEEAFSTPLRLERNNGRYHLRIRSGEQGFLQEAK
jgi:iron complex transport system ATP-binding protein